VAVGLDAHTLGVHRAAAAGGLVQGDGEVAAQAFTRHFQDVVDAGHAGRGLQVHAGAAMQVKNVAAAIDQRRHLVHVLQQGLLGQFAQRLCGRRGCFASRLHQILFNQRRQKPAQRSALRALEIFLALINLGLAVQHGKQVGLFSGGLGGSQKQKTTGLQRVVKQRDQFFLQLGTQVNHQVAATDEVKLGKRGVLDDVMLREHQQVANAFVYAVGAAIGLQRKEPHQPLRTDVIGNADRVKTGAGHCNGTAVDVGGKHLHLVTGPEQLKPLLQQDGDRIRLFAGGAAGAPDAHRSTHRFVLEQPGDDLCRQRRKGIRVAKKIGHTDQHVIEQRLHFNRGLLQVLHVGVNAFDLVHRHAPLDPAVDSAGLVLGKVVSGLGA